MFASRLQIALEEKESELNAKYRDSLPPTDLDFFIPTILLDDERSLNELCDMQSMERLPDTLDGVVGRNNHVFALRTSGDGNCLTSSLSRAMWGSEHWSSLLRAALVAELIENASVYKSMIAKDMQAEEIEDEMWENDFMKPAQTPRSWLGPLHVYALANLLKRPIILYAHKKESLDYGFGVHGVGGTFVPHLVEAQDMVSQVPLAISWSSPSMVHFVPLSGVESHARPQWPILPYAFADIDEIERISIPNEILGNDVTNPFVEEISRLYLLFKKEDGVFEEVCASLARERSQEKSLEDAVEFAAKLECKKLKQTDPEIIDGVAYDLSIKLRLMYSGQSTILTVGFNYEDDPGDVEDRIYAQFGTYDRTGMVAERITQKQLHFEHPEQLYRLSDTPGPGMDGYRYVVEGVEYDMVFKIHEVLLIPLNLEDDIDEVVTKFVTRYNIDIMHVGRIAIMVREDIDIVLRQAKLIKELKKKKQARLEAKRRALEDRVIPMYHHFPEIGPLPTYLVLGRPEEEWIKIVKKHVIQANIESRKMLDSSGLNSLDNILALIASPGLYTTAVVEEVDMAWFISKVKEWPVDPLIDILRALFNLDSVTERIGDDVFGFIVEQLQSKTIEATQGSLRSVRLLLRVLCNMSTRGSIRDVVIIRATEVMSILGKVLFGADYEFWVASKDFCSLVTTLAFNIAAWVWQDTATKVFSSKALICNQIAKIVLRILHVELEPEATFATVRGVAVFGTILCCEPSSVLDLVDMVPIIMMRFPTVLQRKSGVMREMVQDLLAQIDKVNLMFGMTE